MTLFDHPAFLRRSPEVQPSGPEVQKPRSVVGGLLANDLVLNEFGIDQGRVLVASGGMPIPAGGAFLVLGWDAPRFSDGAVRQTLSISAHAGRTGLAYQPIADTPSMLLDRVMTVLIGTAVAGARLFVQMIDRRLLFEELDTLPTMVDIAVFDVRSPRGWTTCSD